MYSNKDNYIYKELEYASLHLADLRYLYEHRDKARSFSLYFFLSLRYNFDATAIFRAQCACLPVHRERDGASSFSEDVPKSLYINVSSGRRRCPTERGKKSSFLADVGRTVGWEVRTSPTPYSTLVPANQTHTDGRVPCLAGGGEASPEHATGLSVNPGVLTRCFEYESQEAFFPSLTWNSWVLMAYRSVKEPSQKR